jgi:hypothetical protein
VAYYNDPDAYPALPAEDGPEDWPRAKTLDPDQAEPVRQAEVSDIVVGTDSISFSVDEPGTPVVVKVSYFPNWEVEGADGPYRVGPNQMVVVPTGREVSLSYGRSAVDLLAMALTLLGAACVFLLWRTDRRELTAALARPPSSDGSVQPPRHRSQPWDDRSLERPAERTVDRPMERPVERTTDQPVERPVAGPLERPAGRTVERPVEQSIDSPVDRTGERQSFGAKPEPTPWRDHRQPARDLTSGLDDAESHPESHTESHPASHPESHLESHPESYPESHPAGGRADD